MAQTRIGALRLAAGKAGCSLEAYISSVANGFKWCYACRRWVVRDEGFTRDSSRTDGLSAQCVGCRRGIYERTYVPRPRKSRRGIQLVPPRDGDKLQARARVNLLVKNGILPKPAAVPCSNCGHIGPDRRHEYHHFKGYGAEDQLTAKVLCSKCHHKDEPNHIGRKRNKEGQWV